MQTFPKACGASDSSGGLGALLYIALRAEIWKVLDREPAKNPMGGPWQYYLPSFFKTCEWSRFFDYCQDVHEIIAAAYSADCARFFRSQINTIFERDGLQWRFEEGGRVERALPDVVAEPIQQTRTLLSDPRLEGPDRQFATALAHLSRRPEPDEENCIKDAIGALEGVARIVSNKRTATLSDLLKSAPLKDQLPVLIRETLQKLYAYRGNEPGVAHGAVGPESVTADEAQWVLGVCAVSILYVAAKGTK